MKKQMDRQMLELVNKLWVQSKRKLVLVLIPVAILILLAIVFKVWKDYLLYSAKKILESMLNKNNTLTKDSNSANKKAEAHKSKADELARKAKATESDNDPDWNKKIK